MEICKQFVILFSSWVLLLNFASGQVQQVATVAGNSTIGSNDAQGTSATFNRPKGVAVDSIGNSYVADTTNNKIRKIDINGTVTTLAGSGTTGSADGTGVGATFSSPTSVFFGTDGLLYVTDSLNNKIRQVNVTTGAVTTFCGSGAIGSADGSALSATFSSPFGIAQDTANGDFYVTDSGNHKIRKISSADRAVTTLAGSGSAGFVDGDGTSASFDTPQGIALAAGSTLYVSDSSNRRIRAVRTNGTVTTLAGNGVSGSADGYGSSATFNTISGVAIDGENNIYVADYGNKIRKITVSGAVSTIAGTGTAGDSDGSGTNATFNRPEGIAFSPGTNNLYVADSNNNKIKRVIVCSTGNKWNETSSSCVVDPTSQPNVLIPIVTVGTVIGNGTQGDADGLANNAMFNYPTDIAIDSKGNQYITDYYNNKIRKVSSAGVVTTFAGSAASGWADGPAIQAAFSNPYSIAIDSDDNFYISDTGNHKIRKIDSSGIVTTIAGTGLPGFNDGPADAASFNYPAGIMVHPNGTIYVADYGNKRIRAIDANGVVSTFAGNGTARHVDGLGKKACFKAPTFIALDFSGNMLVSDLNMIRIITPDRYVKSFVGSDEDGYTEAQENRALFQSLKGIAVDNGNFAIVADSWNNRIRAVSSVGVTRLLAGNGTAGRVDANGKFATFNMPDGIALDSYGNIFVVESNNHVVRKISACPNKKYWNLFNNTCQNGKPTPIAVDLGLPDNIAGLTDEDPTEPTVPAETQIAIDVFIGPEGSGRSSSALGISSSLLFTIFSLLIGGMIMIVVA